MAWISPSPTTSNRACAPSAPIATCCSPLPRQRSKSSSQNRITKGHFTDSASLVAGNRSNISMSILACSGGLPPKNRSPRPRIEGRRMKYCDTCHTTYPNEFSACPKDQAALRETAEMVEGMVIREKYQIVRKIGEGRMATVYQAKHLTFTETRAHKVLQSRLAQDEAFVNRFKTEAVTRRLQHENAVRVEDFDFAEDDSPFLVMEYVEGKSLRSVMRS